jgi:hypothetical protein
MKVVFVDEQDVYIGFCQLARGSQSCESGSDNNNARFTGHLNLPFLIWFTMNVLYVQFVINLANRSFSYLFIRKIRFLLCYLLRQLCKIRSGYVILLCRSRGDCENTPAQMQATRYNVASYGYLRTS